MLTSLDLIIAGFHEPVFPPQDKATHTQAMIAAMASGKVHMISHPGNPKFPVDIPAIAEAAARYQVALEINNSSFVSSRVGSEDNCRAIAAAVRDAGGGWRWARTLIRRLPSGIYRMPQDPRCCRFPGGEDPQRFSASPAQLPRVAWHAGDPGIC
jgi:hypothetical protein